jgi:hypothetical protein
MVTETYLAQFGTSSAEFFTAALAWPAPSGPMFPAAWKDTLQSNPDVDIALRVNAAKQPTVVLTLTSDRRGPLLKSVEALHTSATVPGLSEPRNATEFDALTEVTLPHEHLRLNFEGYHRDGDVLGCDFRLYSVWVGQGLADNVGYQLCLRAHPTGSEQQRRVRKYLAWLELEQPFTSAVRELQQILCRRLLVDSALGDEYLIFPDTQRREAWRERIQTHFAETIGQIGFTEAPLESGDFSDWLATGCHSVRYGEVPSALPVEASYAFSDDEIAWLMRQNVVAPAQSMPDTEPDVFISYASSDFACADAARQYLESRGRRCWIAPRDINVGGFSYTEAIPRAMKQVRAVVVLVSATSNLSVHIPRELDLALERKLPMVPLRLENVSPSGQLEYLLRTCQWLDLFDRDYDEAMSELDSRLRSFGV